MMSLPLVVTYPEFWQTPQIERIALQRLTVMVLLNSRLALFGF
jgi:hypothetical protein